MAIIMNIVSTGTTGHKREVGRVMQESSSPPGPEVHKGTQPHACQGFGVVRASAPTSNAVDSLLEGGIHPGRGFPSPQSSLPWKNPRSPIQNNGAREMNNFQ